MKKYSASKICFLIALAAIFFIPKISSAQAVINEIFSDPAGNDTGKEWIELYNSGSQAIDLSGWEINGSGKYFTIPSFSLEPNSFLLIRWRADGQNTADEIFTGIETINTNLGNTSGFIALFKSAEHNKDTIIDYFEYGKASQTLEATASSAGIWQREQFVTAATEGQSLGLKQDGKDQNLAGDWQIFSAPTPGQSNTTIINTTEQETSQQQKDTTTQSPPSDTASSTLSAFSNYSDEVLINEFMPWPSSGNEWVELLNSGDQTIDLSDWQIDDIEGASSPQKISAGTLIEPNAFLVIELEKNILNNEGDEIRLIWPDGQLIHSVSYKSSKQNFSSSRFEDGLWLWTENPTPGQENKKPAQKLSSPPKTESISLQYTPPLVATVSESLSAPKNENSTNNKSAAVTETDFTTQQNSTQNTDISESLPMEAVTTKKQTLNPFFALAAIAILSLFSGIGIVYFKNKKAIDNGQKPS